MRPIETKLFTLWPFEKVCNPCFKGTETKPWMNQMLQLADKDFKAL